MKDTLEDKDKIALCNIRKIIDSWKHPHQSLTSKLRIEAELDKINL